MPSRQSRMRSGVFDMQAYGRAWSCIDSAKAPRGSCGWYPIRDPAQQLIRKRKQHRASHKRQLLITTKCKLS